MMIKSYDAWRCDFAGSSIKQTNRWENMKTGIVLFSWLTAVAAWAQTFPQGMVTLDSIAEDVPIYYFIAGVQSPSYVFVEVLASVPDKNAAILILTSGPKIGGVGEMLVAETWMAVTSSLQLSLNCNLYLGAGTGISLARECAHFRSPHPTVAHCRRRAA